MSTDFGAKYETARERVFELLSDCAWHDHTELREIGGIRYGARLHELRRLGYSIHQRNNKEHGRRYRLTSTTPGPTRGKRVKVLLYEQDAIDLLRGTVTLTASAALHGAINSYRYNRGKL